MVYISSRGTPTYGYTQPDEFRENPALRKREQYALPTEEDNQTTWNDVGDVVGLGVNQLKRSVGTTLGADDYAEEARKDAEYYYNAMTPQMQRNLNATILPQEGTGNDVWDEDISAAGALGSQFLASAPSMGAGIAGGAVASVAAAAIGAPAIVAAAVGILADRGISGAMTYGEVATSIDDTIRQMDTNTILKNAPTFQSYLDRHKGNEMAAKEEYARDVRGLWPLLGGAVSAALPSAGTTIARRMAGLGPRAAHPAIRAAGREFVGESFEEGFTGYAGQQAPASQGLGEVDWYDVANQSLAGGVLGGTTGGIVGVGAHFLGPQKERAVRSEPADGVDPEKRAALAAASPVEPTAPAPAAGPVPAAPTPPVQAQPEVPPEAAPAEQPVQPTPAPVEPAPVQTAVPTEAEKPLGPKRLEEIVRFEAAGSDITLSDDQIKEVVKGLRGSVRPADIQSGVVASAIDRVAKGLPAKVTEQVKTDEKILAGANNPATGEPVTGTIPEAIADLQAKVDAVARGEITGTVFPSAANVVVPGDVPLVDMGGGNVAVLAPGTKMEKGKVKALAAQNKLEVPVAQLPPAKAAPVGRKSNLAPNTVEVPVEPITAEPQPATLVEQPVAAPVAPVAVQATPEPQPAPTPVAAPVRPAVQAPTLPAPKAVPPTPAQPVILPDVKAEKAWKKKAAKAAAAAIRTDAPTTVEEVTTDKDAFARFKRRVARHVKESATPHPGYVRAAEAIAKLEAAAPKGRAASVHPLRLNVNALMKKEPEWVAEVTASEDEKAKKALSTKASEEPTPSTVARDEAEAKEREAKIKTARRKAENELEQAGLDKELAVSERPVDAGETTKNVVAAIERRAKIIVNIDKLLKPRGGVKSLDRPSLEAMIDVYDKSRATTDDAVKAVATNTVPETAEEAVARAESEVDQVNDDDDVAAVAEIMLAPEPPVTRQVAPPQNLATLVTGYGDTKGKFETVTKKKRTIKIPDRILKLAAGDSFTERKYGQTVEVQAISTVKNMLSDNAFVRPGRGLARVFHELIKRRAIKAIPDVQVLIVKGGPDLELGAYYDPVTNNIVINENETREDPARLAHVVFHELTHALTSHSVFIAKADYSVGKGTELADMYSALLQIQQQVSLTHDLDFHSGKTTFDDIYYRQDIDEFLSELWANPEFQKYLASVPAPTQLLKEIGYKNAANSKMTLWSVIVQMVRKLLRMPPNMTSMLEAAMVMSDAAFQNNYKALNRINKIRAQKARPMLSGEGFDPMFWEDASLSSQVYPIMLDRVREKLRAAVDNPSAKLGVGKWARAMTYLSTTDQVGQMALRTETSDEGKSAIRKLVDRIQRLTPYADKLREESRPLVSKMWDAQRAMPGAFKKYAERLYEVTGYGINLIDADAVSDADLQKANKHLMGKGFDKQQGKARMREYQDWFSSLPAGDRRLIMDVSDYYRRTHEALVDGSIRNTLRAALPNLKKAQVDLVVEASKRNAVTHGTYDAILGKNTVDAINDLASHRTGEGMYFPQMRHGKWVVSWREKLGDTFGGNEVSPGVLEWTGDDAVEQAEKFRDNTNLHVSNFRKSEADDGAPVARLYVQTLGTSFFESEADAADFVKQLRGDPTVEWSSDYSLSDKANYTPQGMTQMSVSKLIANVNQQTNTTSNAALIREAARQAAIQLLPGTRLAQRTLTRRNVKGADTDLARALAQYSEAITRALAKQEFMPELYEAMDAYEKLVKSEPEHPSYRLRRMFLNEFRNRVDSNVVNFSEPPQWVHNLMALSFLDKLFSVAYSVVNSLQPLAVTYPYLAGKFGQVQTVSAIRRAYASIGFTDAVIGGAKNTGKAITNIRRTELLDTSDIHGSIRKKLAAQPDGAALASLFDFATERGAIDPEAGFELAQSIAQSQGKLAEGISRVDRIARQMPQAVEQVNRAVTLVAAYRLAKKAGASHEAAMDEAIVATRNTQGDYSAVNASPVFNTTPGRIALQFKKYAQMMIFLLGDMLYRGFKGATAEERSQARKQIASLVGVQVAFAGVLGLPGLELIRYGAMAMAGLGLGGGYEEWERYVRESISEMTSPYVADLLTRGVIPRALNLDLSAKMGLDSLLTFGEPRDYRQDGVVFFLTSQVVGAPGMLVFDQFRAANEITQGLVNADSEQLLKGIEKIPLGATVTNAIKATRLGTYGVSSGSTGKQFIEPSGVGTMAANVLGFNTAEQSLAYERQGAFRAADTELDDIDRRIRIFRNKYAEADTAGERVKMIKDMKALNESLPEDRRLTRDDLERFRKRYLRDLKEGRVVENYRLGKDIEAERMREIQSVYTR